MKKISLLLFTLIICFTVTSCKKKKVDLSFTTIEIGTYINQTIVLEPVKTNTSSEIVYTFDKEGIIEEIGENTFKALKAGEVTIIATLKDNKKIKAEIKVVVDESHHSHAYDQELVDPKYLVSVATEDSPAIYYKSCRCGEAGTETFTYGEKLPHVFDQEVVNPKYLVSVATEESPAIYYKSCKCGEAGTETFTYGEKLPHVFDQEVVDPKYLVSVATEESPAIYYKSCKCGEAGTETFTYGEKLPHVFDQEVVDPKYLVSVATEDSPAIYYKSCKCGEAGTETFTYGEKLPHVFDQEVVDPKYLVSVATEDSPAIYYKSCKCGEAGTETFTYGEKLPHVFDQEVVDPKYLVSVATEDSPAIYYKSCKCGEAGTETFTYGEKLPHTHVFDQEVVDPKYLVSVATEDSPAIYYKSCKCGETGTETFTYGEKLPSGKHVVNYNLNDGSWSWLANTVSTPKSGIDNDSNLPEIFMGDFYYYLLTNDLLQSALVFNDARLKATSWDLFSTKWTDPVAIYNNNSTGYYSTNDGYAQFFWDSYTNNEAVGGFLGTSPYKEKYANLTKMIYEMTVIKYPSLEEPTFEQGFAFILDGYFYGTQGLMSSGDNYETFNSYRGQIPTPQYGYNGTLKVENDYQISESTKEITLVAPVKEGYAFMGWYENADLSGEAVTTINKSTTLYAKWYDLNYKAPTHNINYALDGGQFNGDVVIVFTEDEETILPIPTKAGFDFLGWTISGETGFISKLDGSHKNDIELIAQWQEKSNVIAINYVYEDGELLTHKAESIDEFITTFWNEFYKWTKSTEGLEAFKTTNLTSWVKGSTSKYKVYLASGKDVIDEEYFVNAKANSRWMAWMIVFDQMVTDINGSQSAFASTYVGYLRLNALLTKTGSLWTASRINNICDAYPIDTPLIEEFTRGQELDLVGLKVEDGRTFLGWYDQDDKLITNTKDITDNITLNAKWSVSTPVESFTVNNQIASIEKFNEHQLSWSFLPLDATNKKLRFVSSNPDVLSIDEEGMMVAHKEGKVTITVNVLEDAKFNVTFDVDVYINPFIDLNFDTVSYVEVGGFINVIPTIYGTLKTGVGFRSLNNDIATINNSGEIAGLGSGYVEMEAYLLDDENVKTTFGVTVLTNEEYQTYQTIVDSHNDDIHVKRDLDVAYDYLTDVYTSVSDLIYNHQYTVDTSYEEKQKTVTSNHGGTKSSTEFICVHYTAGTNKSSGAAATASYFANGGNTSSIHYTTGNDGIYHILDNNLVGFHAGDGTGTTFTWTNTLVKATQNVKPVWGVIKNNASSSGYYFTLNGQATTIVVPTTGTTSSGATKTMTDPSKCFTYFGPAWKVVNGYYYMGTTWACFTQTLQGAISSKGGNNNSIGIETACNRGSDLWLTYQYTAELVARLLDEYQLDFTRVLGHNAFSGKDCPQTLLADGGVLWEIFMECVEAEYNLYTKMTKDNKYTITSTTTDTDYISSNGRVKNVPNYTKAVTYTVTVKDNTTNETKDLTFSTIIHGAYTE